MKRCMFALMLFCACTSVVFAQQDLHAHLSIKSSVLNEERTALIHTSPGYEQNGLRYPVIYMDQGLRKIFDGWLMTAETATGNIPGSLTSVEAHYKTLTARFGFYVVPPEPLVNQHGYQLLGEKKMDEAIASFKANVAHNPNSANVYDSLAQAYETAGQIELARSNSEQAMQVGPQKNDPALPTYKTNFERVAEQMKKKVATKEQ